MGKLVDFLALANAAFGRFASTPLTVRSHADENAVAVVRLGANDGLVVELATGSAAPLPDDAATQTTRAAVLAAIASLAALVTTPGTPTQITASDATDTSAITAKGLLVEVAGDLAIRGTGAPSTTVTITVVAGQYVPVQCSRVMAATTATVVGLS